MKNFYHKPIIDKNIIQKIVYRFLLGLTIFWTILQLIDYAYWAMQ